LILSSQYEVREADMLAVKPVLLQDLAEQDIETMTEQFGMLHMPVDTFWMSRVSSKIRNLL
jgi:hypothetical protein